MSVMAPLERFEHALTASGCNPRNGEALCPVHGDRKPSLSYTEGNDGRVLVTCHAGCSAGAVVAALGLEWKDLFPKGISSVPVILKSEWVSITPIPGDAPAPPPHPRLGKSSNQYQYLDSSGRLLGLVVRWDNPNGKEIRPLTFGRMSNEPPSQNRWDWKSWSGPAPLNGLNYFTREPDAPVLVVEGEKAADAARELFPSHVVTTSPGGSNRAHKADWTPLRGRRVIIWPDADKAGTKFAKNATKMAREAGAATVKLVQVPESWPQAWDLADDPPAGVTVEDLRVMVSEARVLTPQTPENPNPLEPLEALPERPPRTESIAALEAFAALAIKQPKLDTAVLREFASQILEKKGFKAPKKLIDQALADALPNSGSDGKEEGLQLRKVLPADDSVNGISLLDDLAATFSRYIVLPKHAANTLALWIVFSYAYLCFFIAPLLCLSSAEKGSGKTTTLDVIASLVQRPLLAANATVAAIFRSIAAYRPTLLIDEADSFFQDNEDLRGILNAGHRRGGAVLRTVGDDHEPKSFPVWSPKAVALIGRLPGTLADRSIILRLSRGTKNELKTVERFRLGISENELLLLAGRVARWATDHEDQLKAADPEMPESLYGRAGDNWRPLLAVADVVGGDWPQLAREAAAVLSGTADAESNGVMVLEDLKTIFIQWGTGNPKTDRMSSAELVEKLSKMEDRPWPEWRRGQPLSARSLAGLLAPYEIHPMKIRFGERTLQGYCREQFEDAWSRYVIPGKGEKNSNTPPIFPERRNNLMEIGLFGESRPEHLEDPGGDVPDRKLKNCNGDEHCSSVPRKHSPQEAGIITEIDFIDLLDNE